MIPGSTPPQKTPKKPTLIAISKGKINSDLYSYSLTRLIEVAGR
jgi:hypothetical protein